MKNPYIISPKELQERLNWSYTKKIDHSLYIIDSFLAQYPNCRVSFSGGIDSLVLLYLTRIVDKNKEGIYVNTTNEFKEINKFVKNIENIKIITPTTNFIQVIEKRGFPLISKRVAQYLRDIRYSNSEKLKNYRLKQLPNKYHYLIHAPFDISEKCCEDLKKKPLRPFIKEGFLIGTLATDSKLRQESYLRTGCINLNANKALPLSIWKHQEIWKFIKENHIPYCSVYDNGEDHTGCAYCGFGCQFDTSRFARLKEREPKRYKIMMNIKNKGVTYGEAIKYALHLDLEKYTHNMFLGLH